MSETSTEVVKTTENPVNLIEMAVKNNASIDTLERLVALQERWQAQRYKEAFFEALVAFQNECPGVKKTKEALYDGKLQYKYADLSDVINTIKDTAFKHKIAYQFKIKDTPELITVTCLITSNGHTEQTEMSSAPDTSGKKQAIQARGSAIEYMKRYTLAGALGLSISEDNDGGKLMPELTFEEIEIKATSTETQKELKGYYNSLPTKWKNDAKVKALLKSHEATIKAKTVTPPANG